MGLAVRLAIADLFLSVAEGSVDELDEDPASSHKPNPSWRAVDSKYAFLIDMDKVQNCSSISSRP